MKKLTALLTSMMLLACMAAVPVQAAHTFETARTDDYCKELLETCSDCYSLNADGVYTYTKCVYHTGTNMFEPYIANPGTYDRSDLLLSLARIHPESKFLVKIDLHGDISGEAARLAENGIKVDSVDGNTLYAVMNAEQVENFPASIMFGYLLSLAPSEEEVQETPAPAAVTAGDLNGDGKTDIMDVIRLNKALLGVEKLTDAQNTAADLDNDGKMTSNDALALLKKILGTVKQDPVEYTVNLSASYTAQDSYKVRIDEKTILGQTKFALDLLRKTAKAGENTLVSPYSVSQALGMTANGAEGATLEEMETVLGGPMDTLNPAFYTMRSNMSTNDFVKLSTANSIWVKNGYPVRSDFLQKNADFYDADAFAAPFNESTKDDINHWVNEKTDHMVPQILDKIPEGVRMYLINAVAFDAKWEKQYQENKVRDDKFTAADGKKQDVKMLYSDEYFYLADAHATGFMKNYEGGQFGFAALLPEKGMTPEAYLESLTPEALHQMLAEPENTKVKTVMPEFSYDFGTLLNDPLKKMGMNTAFDEERADFSGMTDFSADTDEMLRLYISRVIHKTHIEVSPVGTRAGAAAAVEMMTECATAPQEPPKEVVLDRPFVYMIVDKNTSLPIFIGTLNSVS